MEWENEIFVSSYGPLLAGAIEGVSALFVATRPPLGLTLRFHLEDFPPAILANHSLHARVLHNIYSFLKDLVEQKVEAGEGEEIERKKR